MKRKREDEDDVCKPYYELRRSVLCLSMNKLRSPVPISGHHCRRVEPSLRRSVLICNTVRKIENELKEEGIRFRPVPPSSFSPPAQLLDPPPSTAPAGPWTSLLEMEDDLPNVPSPVSIADLDFAALMLDRDSLSAVLTDSLNALAGTFPYGGCNMQAATDELEHIMEVLVGI